MFPPPSLPRTAGWLKTVDQYFMGANNSIQHAGVQVRCVCVCVLVRGGSGIRGRGRGKVGPGPTYGLCEFM